MRKSDWLIAAFLMMGWATAHATTITHLAVTAQSGATATIQWTTNVAASSQILYGIGNEPIQYSTVLDSTLVTTHTVTLSGVAAGTSYSYEAQSVDASGNAATSAAQIFTVCNSAGLTNVSGTVNNYYEYGDYTFTWVNTSGWSVTPTLCGAALTQTYTGSLDRGASMSQQLPDTQQIVPSPSQWQMTVTGVDGSIGSFSVQQAITPNSNNLTTALQAGAIGNLLHVWYDPATSVVYPPIGDLLGIVIPLHGGTGTGTIPTATQILIGTSGGIYAPQTVTGDISLTAAGVTTVAKVNGVSYPASPSTNTIPMVTAANTVTYDATTGTGAVVLAISAALTGTPTAPTAASGTNTTQIATTAFVETAVGGAVGAGVVPEIPYYNTTGSIAGDSYFKDTAPTTTNGGLTYTGYFATIDTQNSSTNIGGPIQLQTGSGSNLVLETGAEVLIVSSNLTSGNNGSNPLFNVAGIGQIIFDNSTNSDTIPFKVTSSSVLCNSTFSFYCGVQFDTGFEVAGNSAFFGDITHTGVFTNYGGITSVANIETGTGYTATSSTNYSSNSFDLNGSYWTGSAAAADNWTITDVLGSGSNPTSRLTFAHTGSSGVASISIPYPLSVSSLTDTSVLSAAALCTGSGGLLAACSTTGTGAVVLANTPTFIGTVTAPVWNATTGFQINGAAASGHILMGNGAQYVDSSTIPASAITGLYYQTVQEAGTALAQQTILNFDGTVVASTGTGKTNVGLPASGVTAGSYIYPASITVDTYGRTTAIAAGSVVSRVCNANGCSKTDADGTVTQWGVIASMDSQSWPQAFPTTFPTTCTVVTASTYTGTDRITYVDSFTTTGFTLSNNGSGSGATWIALGY